ncbi:centromere protein P-like [Oscarella lobularis]|uniref:centromere protein P-like n=1 Tax=Oscarella lobularis TaxID=121494 RepID=UPI0033134B03
MAHSRADDNDMIVDEPPEDDADERRALIDQIRALEVETRQKRQLLRDLKSGRSTDEDVDATNPNRLINLLLKKTQLEQESSYDNESVSRIRLLEAFTGIHFSSATHKILDRDDGCTQREHHLVGRVTDFDFDIRFTTEEKLDTRAAVDHNLLPRLPEGEHGAPYMRGRMTNLKVSLDEKISRLMKNTVAQAETDNNLVALFKALLNVTEAIDRRNRIFSELSKLPGVQWDGSNRLFLIDPTRKNLKISLLWNSTEKQSGEVTTKLALEVVNFPGSTLTAEETSFQKMAPAQFERLFSETDPEAAVRGIVDIVVHGNET